MNFFVRRSMAGLCALAALCLVHTIAHAATAPLIGGGVNIFVDFNNPQAGRVFLVGSFPSDPNLNLDGLTVNVGLGTFQRTYTLNAQGQATNTPDLFDLHDTGNGFVFILSSLYARLTAEFISNQTATNQPFSATESITFNNTTYAAAIDGTFDAVANKTSRLYMGVITPPKEPLNPPIRFTGKVRAAPNPLQANKTFKIKAPLSLHDLTGPVTGYLHFGDSSAPVRATGADFQTMLKDGIPYMYANEGVYTVRLTLVGATEVAETHIYVVVGTLFDVNSTNGAIVQLIKSTAGNAQLNLTVRNIPRAVNAETSFLDMKGNPVGSPTGGVGVVGNGVRGLTVSNSFSVPGVYVAETIVLDGTDAIVGKCRKTIVIGMNDISAMAIANATNGAEQAAPRDTPADIPITFTSMSGKFVFSSATNPDSVIFNGTLGLPAGYNPNSPTGNDITLSIANVIDTIHLDEKGKFVSPSALARIKTYKLKVPKLPSGVAIGGEIAKVSMTMNTADLDVLGFVSEGVTASVRVDEIGQPSVARFIQVGMLISGQSFSVLAPVSFAPSLNSDFGTMTGRSDK